MATYDISSLFGELLMPLKRTVIVYESNEKRRKRDNLLKSISEIIGKLSNENMFKNVDKLQLFEYIYSRIHLLPYDIKKDELVRRLRKIMVVESMSSILDGLSPEELKELERSFK